MPLKPLSGYAEIAARFRLNFKDPFDVGALWELLFEYAKENQWVFPPDESFEKKYFEKVGAKGDKEILAHWRFKKTTGPAIIYYLDIDFICIALVKHEMVVDGKKMKLNKGELDMYVNGYIDINESKIWDGHPILKYFPKLFFDRIWATEYTNKKMILYREISHLQNFLKNWFKLGTFLPYSDAKNFLRENAYPSYLKQQ